MRLDRFFTQHLFGPFKGFSRRGSGLEIPILMYHSIARDVDDNVHPYYRTVTTPETFEMHMEFLSRSGYQPLTLSEAVGLLQGESDVITLESPYTRHRPVVITFDDGFRDFYSTAFPILERYGFKATVFLTSGLIGKAFLTGRECLSAGEIKELAEKGTEFGSHTINHPQLMRLSRGDIVQELAGSKACIEGIIGKQVSLFSYPYRFPEEDQVFTRKLGNLLAEQGYSAGVTTAIGLSRCGDMPLFLKRLPINDSDDRELFQIKLDGGYDWLHKVQLAYKRFRAMFIN